MILAAEEFSCHHVSALGGRGFVEPVGACLAQQGVRCYFGGARSFLFLYLSFNLALYFGQRFDMSFLFVFHADDVKTIAAFNQIAGLSFGERKGSLLELRDSAAPSDPAQFAAAFCAARVVGILAGDFGEITTGFYL